VARAQLATYPPYSTRVMNEWSYTSAPVFLVCTGTTLPICTLEWRGEGRQVVLGVCGWNCRKLGVGGILYLCLHLAIQIEPIE
jgi:hypothetical protein